MFPIFNCKDVPEFLPEGSLKYFCVSHSIVSFLFFMQSVTTLLLSLTFLKDS